MFTWEIQNFLQQRNYVVTRKEFPDLISNVVSTQIKDVKPCGFNKFRMVTDDGGDFIFSVSERNDG